MGDTLDSAKPGKKNLILVSVIVASVLVYMVQLFWKKEGENEEYG